MGKYSVLNVLTISNVLIISFKGKHASEKQTDKDDTNVGLNQTINKSIGRV